MDSTLHACSHMQGDINVVKWDSTGTYLASGSDDCSVKIWRPKLIEEKEETTLKTDKSDTTTTGKTEEKDEANLKPFVDFREHTREVSGMFCGVWGKSALIQSHQVG